MIFSPENLALQVYTPPRLVLCDSTRISSRGLYVLGAGEQQCVRTANKPFAQLVCCVGDGVSGPPAYDAVVSGRSYVTGPKERKERMHMGSESKEPSESLLDYQAPAALWNFTIDACDPSFGKGTGLSASPVLGARMDMAGFLL